MVITEGRRDEELEAGGRWVGGRSAALNEPPGRLTCADPPEAVVEAAAGSEAAAAEDDLQHTLNITRMFRSRQGLNRLGSLGLPGRADMK